ncbi:MAG: FecR family protein [Patescibacteria group bacterium]
MKSLKIFAALVLVVGFLLGGLTMAMAAVTAPLVFPEAQAELSVRAGSVELQKSGSATWVEVTEPVDVVVGDSVRTGEDSDADLNLYDQGVLHLAENSTMTIDESFWDPENPQIFRGEIFLEAGNLWSRLFDFVSPQSGFEVRTSSTVATVRGTTFWVGSFADKSSRVYVDEHTVQVRSTVDRSSLEVTEGEVARQQYFGQRPNPLTFWNVTADDSRLIEKYRKWDAKYETDLRARQLAFAHQARKIDPESSLYNFQRFSERVRLFLALNQDQQDELRARFMAGRVLDAYIEFAEHSNVTRTKILLQHAQEFGGDNIATHPKVRQALLYFGRNRAQTPASLRDLVDTLPPLEPVAETIIDTQIQLDTPKEIPVDDTPTVEELPVEQPAPTPPKEQQPTVQGESAEYVPLTY